MMIYWYRFRRVDREDVLTYSLLSDQYVRVTKTSHSILGTNHVQFYERNIRSANKSNLLPMHSLGTRDQLLVPGQTYTSSSPPRSSWSTTHVEQRIRACRGRDKWGSETGGGLGKFQGSPPKYTAPEARGLGQKNLLMGSKCSNCDSQYKWSVWNIF